MRKRAALLLAAVMLCGCKAETSEAAERITSETEPETSSSEETADRSSRKQLGKLPRGNPRSPRPSVHYGDNSR